MDQRRHPPSEPSRSGADPRSPQSLARIRPSAALCAPSGFLAAFAAGVGSELAITSERAAFCRRRFLRCCLRSCRLRRRLPGGAARPGGGSFSPGFGTRSRGAPAGGFPALACTSAFGSRSHGLPFWFDARMRTGSRPVPRSDPQLWTMTSRSALFAGLPPLATFRPAALTAFAARFGGELRILRKATLLVRNAFASLACNLSLLGSIHRGKTPIRLAFSLRHMSLLSTARVFSSNSPLRHGFQSK